MPDNLSKLMYCLSANNRMVHAVVPYDSSLDRLHSFDFSNSNKSLTADIFSDTERFSEWIASELETANCRYGIGGYNEHRAIYSRSKVFGSESGARRLHLGTDIWGASGTTVYSPLDAVVHSFALNNNFGDYGATIILSHNLGSLVLYTLYGHLNKASLAALKEGKEIAAGEQFAEFGKPSENGSWPPHLHFQLIFDLMDYAGDYPGVCAFSDRQRWLQNSPDPDLILRYTFKKI